VHRSVSPTRLGSADADPREEVLVEVDVVVHVVTAVRVADAVTDELRRGRMRGGRRRVGPVDLSPLEYSLGNSVASIGTRPGSGDIDALFAGLEQLLADFSDDQVFGFELILESRRRPELRPHVEAMYSAYRAALRHELECAGIDCDDSLVHLVFAATRSPGSDPGSPPAPAPAALVAHPRPAGRGSDGGPGAAPAAAGAAAPAGVAAVSPRTAPPGRCPGARAASPRGWGSRAAWRGPAGPWPWRATARRGRRRACRP
jgi:hypothetical protein